MGKQLKLKGPLSQRSMKLHRYLALVQGDLYRYDGAASFRLFLQALWSESGFRYIWLLRTCRFLRSQWWGRWCLYHLTLFWLTRLSARMNVFIDPSTEIGAGFGMGHAYGIIINRRCRIGTNFSLSQNVTLGRKSREPNVGCPTIGDRVYIGPGAVIIGDITIGNDAAIGANAVVTKDVPANAVVVGVPGRIVSDRGSAGYVTWPCQPTSCAEETRTHHSVV
jgi:serine O-acetyltransferase